MIRREDDMLVDLVGDHVCVILVAQTADEQQLFLCKDLAAGIGGVADDNRLGVLAESIFQYIAVKVERRRDKRNENRIRAGENGIRTVILIERREDDDLVAGVADGHHRAHHRLGAAAGDENLGIRINRSAVGTSLLAGEGFAEVFRAEGHGILMRAFVRDFAQAVGDGLGRRKIRKTLGEIDSIDLVADARHAADDGVGERLNTMAQFWHKYSHLSKTGCIQLTARTQCPYSITTL